MSEARLGQSIPAIETIEDFEPPMIALHPMDQEELEWAADYALSLARELMQDYRNSGDALA